MLLKRMTVSKNIEFSAKAIQANPILLLDLVQLFLQDFALENTVFL